MNLYDITAKDIRGNDVPLSRFSGQALLIVNTASKCGFTPQFAELEELYQKYKDRGFVVLGFPCNQFGEQDPGSNDEIASFCSINYGVTFPMFGKIDVNGDNAHPLYGFLKSQKGGVFGNAIKWNFTKFLVDRSGNVVSRHAPTQNPKKLAQSIERLL